MYNNLTEVKIKFIEMQQLLKFKINVNKKFKGYSNFKNINYRQIAVAQ